MNTQPISGQKPNGKKLAAIVVTTIALIAIAIGGAVVKVLFTKSDSASPTRTFSPAEWSTHKLTDISLEAPFEFRPGPDMKNLAPAVREMIENYEILDSGEKAYPQSTISRIVFKPGVELNLDGSVEGAMKQAMRPFFKAGGDPGADYTATPTTIDGLEARRATFSGKVRGREWYVDAVFVLNEQKLWGVQVLSTNKDSVPDAKRILDSIHINPNQPQKLP